MRIQGDVCEVSGVCEIFRVQGLGWVSGGEIELEEVCEEEQEGVWKNYKRLWR